MTERVVLLVEGSDDEHALGHICIRRGITRSIDIRQRGGYPNLIGSLATDLSFGGPAAACGIIVDADTDAAARWQAVRGRLGEAGYQNLPARLDPAGAVIEPPQDSILPRAGVWVIPNNQSPGALEDLLRSMIPDNDKTLSHAQACVDSLPAQSFRDVDRLKAVMHTWLAWQAEPGRPYGTSIKVGFLDASVPQLDSLVAWLERLFNQSQSTIARDST